MRSWGFLKSTRRSIDFFARDGYAAAPAIARGTNRNETEIGGVMKNFVSVVSIICVVVVIVCAGCNQAADVTEKKNAPIVLKGDYLGQTPPGDTGKAVSFSFGFDIA